MVRTKLTAALLVVVWALSARIGYGQELPGPQPFVPPSIPTSRILVDLPTGWNLVSAGVAAGVLGPPPQPGAPAPQDIRAYTLQAGDSAYETASNAMGTAPLSQRAAGFWVYLAAQAQTSVSNTEPSVPEVALPPSQWILIGNPSSFPATVTGADAVYSYDPVGGGYERTSSLGVGQGAFAYSGAGGTVRLDGSGCTPDTTASDTETLRLMALAPAGQPATGDRVTVEHCGATTYRNVVVPIRLPGQASPPPLGPVCVPAPSAVPLPASVTASADRYSYEFPAGWNLVSGAVAATLRVPPPPGFTAGTGETPAYTLQAGDSAYETFPATVVPNVPIARFPPSEGIWIYLTRQSGVQLAPKPDRTQQTLPAGHWIMVGNPSSCPALVTGADVVYRYDPLGGEYQQGSMLGAGEGAFVYSAAGSTVTVNSFLCPGTLIPGCGGS